MARSRFAVLLKKERGFEKVVDTISRLFEGEGWAVNRTLNTDYVIILPRVPHKTREDLIKDFRRFVTKGLYLDRLIVTDSIGDG